MPQTEGNVFSRPHFGRVVGGPHDFGLLGFLLHLYTEVASFQEDAMPGFYFNSLSKQLPGCLRLSLSTKQGRLIHTLFLSAAFISGLSACQTPRHVEFRDVQRGMEKDLVIEAAGGPNKSRRWNGKDRWIYEYKRTPDGPQTREVHFENGKAVYVGEPIPPVISAEVQDRVNADENQAEEEALSAERLEWEKRHGVARLKKVSDVSGKKGTKLVPTFQIDRDYLKVLESYHGPIDREAEKNIRAPTFEAID